MVSPNCRNRHRSRCYFFVKVRDASKVKPEPETKPHESRKPSRQQEAAALQAGKLPHITLHCRDYSLFRHFIKDNALFAGEDVPAPGYIQSIINRIVNNVNIG